MSISICNARFRHATLAAKGLYIPINDGTFWEHFGRIINPYTQDIRIANPNGLGITNQLRITNYESITNQLRITNYELRITNQLRITNYVLSR